jgi:hypothetical protein
LKPNFGLLKDLIKPIKEEEKKEELDIIDEKRMQRRENLEESESEGGDSDEDSLKTINESMSILDNSLNMDPDYTSNNLFIDQKNAQFR